MIATGHVHCNAHHVATNIIIIIIIFLINSCTGGQGRRAVGPYS
jgi:hypothetical protein